MATLTAEQRKAITSRMVELKVRMDAMSPARNPDIIPERVAFLKNAKSWSGNSAMNDRARCMPDLAASTSIRR